MHLGYKNRLLPIISLSFYISQQKRKSSGILLTASIKPFQNVLNNKKGWFWNQLSLSVGGSGLYTVVPQFRDGFYIQVWVLGESFISAQGPVHQPGSQTLAKGQPCKQAFLRVGVSGPAVTSSAQVGSFHFSLFQTTLGWHLYVCPGSLMLVFLLDKSTHEFACQIVCVYTRIYNFYNCCQIELQKDCQFTFLLTVYARDSPYLHYTGFPCNCQLTTAWILTENIENR